jgi:hypothetical protein
LYHFILSTNRLRRSASDLLESYVLEEFEVVEFYLGGVEESGDYAEVLEGAGDEVADVHLGLAVLLEVEKSGEELQAFQALELVAVLV